MDQQGLNPHDDINMLELEAAAPAENSEGMTPMQVAERHVKWAEAEIESMRARLNAAQAKASEYLQKGQVLAAAYGHAMIVMADFRFFVGVTNQKGWDRFDACIYCARKRHTGHLDGCALNRARKTLENAPTLAEDPEVMNPIAALAKIVGIVNDWQKHTDVTATDEMLTIQSIAEETIRATRAPT